MPSASHRDRAEPLLDAEVSSVSAAQVHTQFPEWIEALRAIFDACARIDEQEEGPISEVWVLGTMQKHVQRPNWRLDNTQFMWRSAVMLDSIQRAQPIDFHVVSPTPMQEPWQTASAHMLLSQHVAQDLRASLVSNNLLSAVTGRVQRPALMPRSVHAVDVCSVLSTPTEHHGQVQLFRGESVVS